MSLSSYEIPLGVWPLSYALHKDMLCLFRSQIVLDAKKSQRQMEREPEITDLEGSNAFFPLYNHC